MDALIASSSKGGEDEVVFRMPRQMCKMMIREPFCVPINLCLVTLNDGEFTTTTHAAYLLYQRDETVDHQIPTQLRPHP